MPTLNWIGKDAVVNHHRRVPFRLLKDVPALGCGELGEGNLIVRGDKGADGCSSDDARDKRAVGAVWASRNRGRCVFVMTTRQDLSVIERVVRS